MAKLKHKTKQEIVQEELEKKVQQSPIYEKPSWKANDVFTINGAQLQEITTLASAFRGLINISDEILRSGELAGTIETQFVYADGSPVSKADSRLEAMKTQKEEELAEMRKQIEDYQNKIQELQNAAKEMGAKTEEEITNEGETATS